MKILSKEEFISELNNSIIAGRIPKKGYIYMMKHIGLKTIFEGIDYDQQSLQYEKYVQKMSELELELHNILEESATGIGIDLMISKETYELCFFNDPSQLISSVGSDLKPLFEGSDVIFNIIELAFHINNEAHETKVYSL